MRLLLTLFFALSILLPGCKFRPDMPPKPGETAVPEAGGEALPMEELDPIKALTVGDVEAVVEIRALIAAESLSDQVRQEEFKTPSQRVTMVRATVTPPHPRQLWLQFDLTDTYDYDDRPVVIRGVIYRQIDDGEEVPIGQLNSIIGVNPEVSFAQPERYGARSTRIDVLADLNGMPETMLVFLRAKAMLLPVSTDLEQLDPETTEAPPADTTTLRSNPVRINVVSETAATP